MDAYTHHGYTVEITQQFETFARLAVTDPAEPEHPYKVELAANWRAQSPVQMGIGPVLHPDDVVAGKMSALFTRAEPRDFLDVDAAITSSRLPANACVSLLRRPMPASTGESLPTSSLCWSATPIDVSRSTAPMLTTSAPCGPASPIGAGSCSMTIPSVRSPRLRTTDSGRNGTRSVRAG